MCSDAAEQWRLVHSLLTASWQCKVCVLAVIIQNSLRVRSAAHLEQADGDGDGVDDHRQREQPQVPEAALADLAAALSGRLRTWQWIVDVLR